MILPILTTISKCFQAGVASFAKIVPTLQNAKEQLQQIATNETRITVLKQVQVTAMSGIIIKVIL